MTVRGPAANFGHAIAYHPQLAAFFDSVTAAVFFAQLRYWMDRTDNPLGVYKTAEEWTIETGLSYREQATARRVLAERGFVVETHKRLEHRLFYRIDWDAFNVAHGAWLAAEGAEVADRAASNSPIAESAIREELKAQPGDCGKRKSLKGAEITSDTTYREEDLKTLAPSASRATPTAQRALIPADPPVILLPTNKTGADRPVSAAEVAEWSALYPAVDVMQELRNMRGWLLANPTRRKTAGGITAFANNWLSKAQNQGSNHATPQQHRNAPRLSQVDRVRAANAARGLVFGADRFRDD